MTVTRYLNICFMIRSSSCFWRTDLFEETMYRIIPAVNTIPTTPSMRIDAVLLHVLQTNGSPRTYPPRHYVGVFSHRMITRLDAFARQYPACTRIGR